MKLLWLGLLIALVCATTPMACVTLAKETGILVRQDCLNQPTRAEKIACGKRPIR